ncbi:hypothetical protein [Rhodoferax ferrireducens]|uniref:hypothetical protein n=1 Tax=Rhodoferax ferrireducens TaxID=192843 RepID=UPI000E0D9F51|nr:hypothetical protein [Rhodoferax ferrireducens]
MGENDPLCANRHKFRQATPVILREIATSLALLLLLCVFNVAAANTVLGGKVIGVLDGDTIDNWTSARHPTESG